MSIPYGLSIGVAGMLSYLPLPAKMRAAVLDPIDTGGEEPDAELAARVEAIMADRLDAMTRDRVPILGIGWDELPFAANQGPR